MAAPLSLLPLAPSWRQLLADAAFMTTADVLSLSATQVARQSGLTPRDALTVIRCCQQWENGDRSATALPGVDAQTPTQIPFTPVVTSAQHSILHRTPFQPVSTNATPQQQQQQQQLRSTPNQFNKPPSSGQLSQRSIPCTPAMSSVMPHRREIGTSALELLRSVQSLPCIYTSCQELDSVLSGGVSNAEGGVPLRQVTEFCGVPGIGSQLNSTDAPAD